MLVLLHIGQRSQPDSKGKEGGREIERGGEGRRGWRESEYVREKERVCGWKIERVGARARVCACACAFVCVTVCACTRARVRMRARVRACACQCVCARASTGFQGSVTCLAEHGKGLLHLQHRIDSSVHAHMN